MENKKKKIFYFLILGAIILKIILIFLPGYQYDLITHQKWSNDILKYGVFSIYQKADPGSFPINPNLPPLWIYILAITSFIYRLIFHSPIVSQWFLKIPAVLADIFTAYFIFYFLRKKIPVVTSFLISFIYLLHPFILYNSSIWGQWDSLFVLPLILCFIFLEKNKPLPSLIFLTLAFLTKLQAVIFFPLILFYIWKKYKIKKLISALFASSLTIILTCLPFLIKGTSFSVLFEKTWQASSKMYPYLSMNAFNLWWLPQAMQSRLVNDSELFIGPLNYKLIGLGLFALSYLFILLWLNKREKKINSLILASVFISFCFYSLPTEIHERYIFPLFALFCLILPFEKELRKIFAVISLTTLLNLVYVLPLTFLSLKWQTELKIILGQSSTLIVFIHLSVFFYFLFYLLNYTPNKKFA